MHPGARWLRWPGHRVGQDNQEDPDGNGFVAGIPAVGYIPQNGACGNSACRNGVFRTNACGNGPSRTSAFRGVILRALVVTALPWLFFLPADLVAQEEAKTRLPAADSTLLIEEVTVEAYQMAGRLNIVPGNITRISGDALATGDGLRFADLLNTLPGVTMHSGTLATGRIVIRGMGSRTPYNTNRIRAYLDGIPLTGSDGISSPEDLDFAGLGRMEVIRGPSSALYGSGLGGSIALYTPVSQGDSGTVSMQYGSFGTGNLRLAGSLQGEQGQLWSSVSHLHSNGFRENDLYRRSSVITSGRWRGKGVLLSSTLLVTAMKGGIPSSLGKTLFEESPSSAAPNWKATGGYQKFTHLLGGITLAVPLTAKTSGRVTLYGKVNDDYEKRPFNNLDDRAGGAGVRGRITRHGTLSEWIAGGEWSTESYSWLLDKEEVLLNKNQENRRQWQLFAMVYYRPVPRLLLSLAGAVSQTRYLLDDLFAANGDQSGERLFPVIFSPRAGMSFEVSEAVTLFAAAGHGYSLPSPEETLLPGGNVNPAIRHEEGIQVEVGARATTGGGAAFLEASLYRIDLRDLLVTKRVTEEIFTGSNAGKSRHYGLELTAGTRFFRSGAFPGELSSRAALTLSGNKFVEFTDDGVNYDGKHLPGIPGTSVQGQLFWKPFPFLEMQVHLSQTGRQYLNDANSAEQPGYFLANIKGTARVATGKGKVLTVHGGVNNLSDTRYASMIVVNALAAPQAEPRYYYPGMPRNGFLGVTLGF